MDIPVGLVPDELERIKDPNTLVLFEPGLTYWIQGHAKSVRLVTQSEPEPGLRCEHVTAPVFDEQTWHYTTRPFDLVLARAPASIGVYFETCVEQGPPSMMTMDLACRLGSVAAVFVDPTYCPTPWGMAYRENCGLEAEDELVREFMARRPNLRTKMLRFPMPRSVDPYWREALVWLSVFPEPARPSHTYDPHARVVVQTDHKGLRVQSIVFDP